MIESGTATREGGTFMQLVDRYPVLGDIQESILAAYEEIKSIYEGGGKLLICGNGGSASDADHLSGELLKAFSIERGMDEALMGKLPEHFQGKLQGALPAIPLTAFPSLMTAYANDCDGDYVFSQLVQALGAKGDGLLAISTSGNSQNVLYAVEVANAMGMRTIGLTGASGGELGGKVSLSINVPESNTQRIQELHLPVYHALAMELEHYFFG